MKRLALLLPLLALAAAPARAEDPATNAFAQRLAIRHVPVPAWLVGEAPDWIDPEAPPPDLPWKDLKRAPPPFPPDYEVEGVLVPENPNLTWRGPETRLGLQLGCGGEAAVVFGVDPAAGTDEWTVKLGDAKYPEKMETVARFPARGDDPFPFRVVQRGGLVSLWIDGQEILSGCDAVRRLADPDRIDCRVVLQPRDLKVQSLRFRAALPAEE